RRMRSKRSRRNICGAFAPPVSFSATTIKPSSSHSQRHQAERADDYAPPGEQRKTVAGDVVQEGVHHDNRGDERYHESDRDDADMIGRHLGALLVKIISEG